MFGVEAERLALRQAKRADELSPIEELRDDKGAEAELLVQASCCPRAVRQIGLVNDLAIHSCDEGDRELGCRPTEVERGISCDIHYVPQGVAVT